HPFNPLAALRLIIAAGSGRQGASGGLDGGVRERRALPGPAVVSRHARQLGVADVARAVSDPAVKEELRANTDWAIAQGVFGVPTLIIGTELFWGHDAFGMARDYLSDPQPFQDRAMQ